MSHRRKNRHLSEQPSYTGEFTTPVNIQLINYSDKGFKERYLKTEDKFDFKADNGSITWIRVHGMSNSKLIIDIVKRAGLSELDAKDILTTEHIMSIEEYPDSIFVVMPVVYRHKNKAVKEQVALIMGGNFLVSIQESDYPLFDNVYQSIKNNGYVKFAPRKSDFLLATLINEVVNYYGDYVMYLEDSLEDLEDELLDIKKQMRKDLITDIQERRREVIRLRKLLVPFKDQLAKLLRADSNLIHPQEIPYFKDIYDQLLYILRNIESCREILSSLVDLYLNNNDVKMNLVMKQLTVVATIFIPLTFLVGVWGMNFSFMPELDWHYGYITAWALMIAIGVGVWLYLKKKDWM